MKIFLPKKNAANVSRRGGINLNACNTLQRFQNHKVKLKHRHQNKTSNNQQY
jgi:hypothetical protein